jgi:hypothetical protein
MKSSAYVWIAVVSILSTLAASDLFGEAGPMLNTGRIGPASATADDGRLILAGGHGSGFTALASMEIGNPETDAFTQISLPGKFDFGAIARLQDGRYLFAGSAADWGVAPGFTSAYIFDPSTDTVSATGNMNYARMNCSGTTLGDGSVLVVGGWYNSSSPVYGDRYDPASGTFTATGPLSTARSIPVVLPTADGRAVVIGGSGTHGGAVNKRVEIYDPASNSFSILRSELVEDDPGWLATGNLKDSRDLLLDNGLYAFLAYKTGSPTSYGFALFDPATLACTVHEIPAHILDGDGIGSSAIAIEGSRIYFLMARLVGSGPATTVRIGGYDTSIGPEQAAVTEAINLDFTPYYAACAIRGGRFFAAGATSSTGSQANFGSVPDTFFAELPQLGQPDYTGWFYIAYPWMYYHDGKRWIYMHQNLWAYDFALGRHFIFGGQ